MDIDRMLSSKGMQEWLQQAHRTRRSLEQYKKTFQNNKPFPHLELHHFLNEEKAKQLLAALQKEPLYEKEADLFKFMQSNDFAATNIPLLRSFQEFLSSEECVAFLEYITETKLKAKEIDMAASLYQNTDYLLPHDDRLEKRKIAYMCYFSNFKDNDGGKLLLYSTENKKPLESEKAVIPEFNMFVCFKVSEKSFHEVEEIIVNKQRITIGGWFHGH